MTLEKAKKIIKSECYIADLLNLDRTRMVNTALDTVIEAAEEYEKMYEKVVACNTSEREKEKSIADNHYMSRFMRVD